MAAIIQTTKNESFLNQKGSYFSRMTTIGWFTTAIHCLLKATGSAAPRLMPWLLTGIAKNMGLILSRCCSIAGRCSYSLTRQNMTGVRMKNIIPIKKPSNAIAGKNSASEFIMGSL